MRIKIPFLPIVIQIGKPKPNPWLIKHNKLCTDLIPIFDKGSEDTRMALFPLIGEFVLIRNVNRDIENRIWHGDPKPIEGNVPVDGFIKLMANKEGVEDRPISIEEFLDDDDILHQAYIDSARNRCDDWPIIKTDESMWTGI